MLNFVHVAQGLEHHSYKVGVDGSNPSMPTKIAFSFWKLIV